MDGNFREFIESRENLMKPDLTYSDIKDTAVKLLSGIAYNTKCLELDKYMENAIIAAYEFEKYWRSRKWEKLVEKEKKSEICQ